MPRTVNTVFFCGLLKQLCDPENRCGCFNEFQIKSAVHSSDKPQCDLFGIDIDASFHQILQNER